MKYHCRKAVRAALAMGFMSLTATGTRAVADNTLSGFYVNTDVGLNLTSDLNAPTVSVSLRPGVRADASVGRAWDLFGEFSAAAELETGILYNTVDEATSQGQSVSAGGSLMAVPLLTDAVLRWQFQPHWFAYGGAGVGCAFSSLHFHTDGSNYGLPGTDANFAWQTMAGIRYQFGSSELGLGYVYFTFKRSGLQSVGHNSIVVSYTFCF